MAIAIEQEYCKDKSCGTCEGTGQYFDEEENNWQPCVQFFEPGTGREIVKLWLYDENRSLTFHYVYQDDGTLVPPISESG